MSFDGPTTQLKPHVFLWTQNLMSFNGPLMFSWVHQKTWGFWVHRKTWVHKKLMSFDGPRLLNLIGSIKRHEVSKVHQRTSGLYWSDHNLTYLNPKGGVHKLRLQDLSFFYHLPPSVYIFYGLKVYKKSIFLTTYPPALVNVVCERPLSCRDRDAKDKRVLYFGAHFYKQL